MVSGAVYNQLTAGYIIPLALFVRYHDNAVFKGVVDKVVAMTGHPVCVCKWFACKLKQNTKQNPPPSPYKNGNTGNNAENILLTIVKSKTILISILIYHTMP